MSSQYITLKCYIYCDIDATWILIPEDENSAFWIKKRKKKRMLTSSSMMYNTNIFCSHLRKCSSVSWPFKWNKCIHQSKATLIFRKLCDTETKDAIMQKESYKACLEFTKSIMMTQSWCGKRLWSDQISHNSEWYLCCKSICSQLLQPSCSGAALHD